jgi:hypothetical protein
MEGKLHLIANIATIISIFIALGIFIYEQNKENVLEKQNRIALLESLKVEIKSNLEFIEKFNESKEHFKASNEIIMSRFSTLTLEEVISKGEIGNITEKIEMRAALDSMTLVNRELEPFQSLFLLYTLPEQYRTYHELKNQTIDVVSNNNYIIKQELELLDAIKISD